MADYGPTVDLADWGKAEFVALRAEIDRRSSAQLTLLSVNLTAFATLTGLALTGSAGERLPLLLLLPVISACTGLIWIDHDRVIHEIGDYIGRSLWPTGLENFERRVDVLERRILPVALEFAVPVMLVFLLPALTALVWTWSLNLDGAKSALRAVGGVVSAVYVILFFMRVFVRWHRANYDRKLPA